MAAGFLRRFKAALAIAAALCVPCEARSFDVIDQLERQSVALVFLDNTEFGVGFVVASNATSSYLLTAAHVLGCADTERVGCRDRVKVRFVGELSALNGTKVLASKSPDGTDLALVKIDRGNQTPVPILSQVATDEEFYVIGFSSAIIEAGDRFGGVPEVHDGNVSRVDSTEAQNFIEVSVPAYPGFSGGPIVDKSTRAVIGVFSGHLRPEDQTRIDYQGVGPARILRFLAKAQALTNVPFKQTPTTEGPPTTPVSVAAVTPVEAPRALPPPPVSAAVNVAEAVPVALAAPTNTPPINAPPTNVPSPNAPPTRATSEPSPAVRVGKNAATAQPAASGAPPTAANAAFSDKLSAANAGRADAQYLTGLAYLRGDGVEPDAKAGISWLTKSAVAQYLPAIGALAKFYESGSYVAADAPRAFALYKAAADLGDPQAAYDLARIYHYGKLGVTPDEAQSQAWYGKAIAGLTKASKAGDGNATWRLAELLLSRSNANGATQNGLVLLELAADQGSPGATNNLAALYWNGRVVERDTPKALELFAKAAQLGWAPAAASLSTIYFDGIFGVQQDKMKGRQFLETAAALGDAHSMVDLGRLLLYGSSFPRDPAAAGVWFRRAAALGDAWGEEQYGEYLIATGPATARDVAQGLALLKDAAAKGRADAQLALGAYYRSGQYVPQDYGKAFTYFQQAAYGGLPAGQFAVAQAFYLGQGVPADAQQAGYWTRLSANADFPPAVQRMQQSRASSRGENRQHVKHQKPSHR